MLSRGDNARLDDGTTVIVCDVVDGRARVYVRPGEFAEVSVSALTPLPRLSAEEEAIQV
jgi:hypothetical protein